MATLGSGVMTLLDWAKLRDPDGKIATIAELLAQNNSILADMPFKEGNLPTGERVTVRTGLPSVYWRQLNAGVPTSNSTSAQVDEGTGILEAWSEVDKDLAELGGNVNQVRLSEDMAFIEAMNQEMASTLFYGDATAPEEFTGFSDRFSDLSAANAENIIDAGGTQSDNSSIWLVGWGMNSCYGIFPQGSMAGLEHEDHGLVTVETSAGVAGNRMRAYQSRFCFKAGLVVKDWRYVVRVANIDISVLIADPGAATIDLIDLMVKAIHRLPSTNNVTPAFYCNRTIAEMLDVQSLNKSNVYLTAGNEEGKQKLSFRGIPLKTVDALTEAEARVT